MIGAPLLALANPIFAVAGVILLALFLFGLVKRLIKAAIFFGIAAVVAWVVFFGG